MSAFFGEVRPNNKKCCVPGCKDKYSSRFRFPNRSQQHLVSEWLECINNPKLKTMSFDKLYKSCVVCARHFLPEQLQYDCRRGLTPNAIPVLFLNEDDPKEPNKICLKQYDAMPCSSFSCDVKIGFDKFNLESIAEKGALLIDGGYIAGPKSHLIPISLYEPTTYLEDPLKIEPIFMNEVPSVMQCTDSAVPSVIISEIQGRNTFVDHTRAESQGCVSQSLRGYTTSELSPNLSSIDCSPDPNNVELDIEQEDASNAEEFLTKQADSELYCRLCLCVSQDSNSYINIFPSGGASSTRQEKIQQMLQDIIPDLDLTLTYNPGICSDCEARLIASYDFISLCTQNQDMLRNYKSRSAGRFVNIHAVVEAHNPTKKRKMIASSAKGKKQKTTLATGINEDAVGESSNRNVSSLTSDTETTFEHIEIKVEVDPDIHQDSREYSERMEGIGDQNAFIQSYSILTEQADDIRSLYETVSTIPASLGEETDHVSAEHTQPIIENIQSDVSIVRSESVNIGNVPLNVGSRFRIKIVEPRTYGSKGKSNNSAKK